VLIHEICRGDIEDVGGIKYVHPPWANRPMLLPTHVDVFEEADGTKTLSGEIHVKTNEGLFACYLIHGSWSRHKIGK
jgi:hypothetical protein